MPNNDLKRYTMRISNSLLDRLYYIARYEGRTANKQLEYIIKRHIAAFEKQHGEITNAMLEEMYSNK